MNKAEKIAKLQRDLEFCARPETEFEQHGPNYSNKASLYLYFPESLGPFVAFILAEAKLKLTDLIDCHEQEIQNELNALQNE
jgi:hypothetical protein